jgi:hypothetical protein
LDTFLANAEEILRTAEGRRGEGMDEPDFTFLVGPRGEIQMIAGSDWPLESLQRERGAAVVYRVGRGGGRTWVEGRSLWRTCRLESPSPAAVARRLLGP